MTTPATHKEPFNERTTPPGAVYTGVVKTRRTPSWLRPFGTGAFAVVAALSIGAAVFFSFSSASSGSDPRSSLTLIAPAGAGGGWDGFSRELQQSMRTEGLANNVQVVNIPGAGGTIGLSAFVNQAGQDNTLLATGAAMVGGIVLNKSPVDLDDVRPIARVAEDYSVFIVREDAPWQTIEDLADQWASDPASVRYTGGSAGAIDHLLVAQFAQVQDIAAEDITYIPKSGGAEAIATLLSDTADVAVTGYNEVEDQIVAGRVRALALSAPERLEGVDIPTFEEEGIAVNLVNWRGLVAHKGISDEHFAAVKELLEETVQSPAWADSLSRNKWQPSYLEGDELEEFLREDQERTTALIEELGL